MADEWYFNSGGQVQGPVSFAALKQLLDEKRIQPDDKVRAGSEGPWRFANSVPHLSTAHAQGAGKSATQVAPASKPGSAARVECFYRIGDRVHGPTTLRTLKELASVSGETVSEIVVRRGQTGDWLPLSVFEKSVADEMATVLVSAEDEKRLGRKPDVVEVSLPSRAERSTLPQPVSSSRSMAQRGSSKSGALEIVRGNARFLAALVIWLGINGVLMSSMFRSYVTEREYVETFRAIHDELREMRLRSVSDAEWREFTERSQRLIEPIVKDLEKTANVSEPIRQRLLWTGRDHLCQMLSSQPDKGHLSQQPSQAEDLFDQQMSWLERALSEQ